MQTLLEWAVDNIEVWEGNWTHLRSDRTGVFFTEGSSWCDLNFGQWCTDNRTPWKSLTPIGVLSVDVITKQEWLDAVGAALTKPPVLKLSLEEVVKDAEEDWGVALNSCGWLSSDIWREHFGEETTPRQFNNLKGFLREIIIHYLTEVYKDDTTPLLEEIETKKKELAELESKLKESRETKV